jgi:hypothetical protein
MRRLAITAATAATLGLVPATASAQSFDNCPTSSSSRVQGLTAGGGATCRKARAIARRVGNRNPRGTIRVLRYRCRVANRSDAGRGWACNRGGKFVSWVYVT